MRFTALTGALLVILAVPACKWNVGDLDVRLVFDHNANPLSEDRITTLWIRVEGDGMSPIENEFYVDDRHSGTVPEVPVGDKRVVTVEGRAIDGWVYSRG